MTLPYARRQLNVTFQLGKGSFGQSGFDSITFKAPSTGTPGMRVYAEVSWANLPQQIRGVIRIYGMTLDHMNQLTNAGRFYEPGRDKVLVQAGDVGGALTTVFQGEIIEAYPDFREMPNTAFQVVAQAGAGTINLKPVEPTSFEGATPAPTAMGQIAQKCGLTLENNGVNAVLSNPYFPGAGITQINRAVLALNCFGTIDPMANQLAIWPKGGSRAGAAAQIGPNTGMIGYPEFERNFVRIRSLFDSSLYSGPGKKINVDSQFTAAQGEWTLIQVDLTLASEMDGGPWEMLIKAYKNEAGATAPTGPNV